MLHRIILKWILKKESVIKQTEFLYLMVQWQARVNTVIAPSVSIKGRDFLGQIRNN
jgi:hypothetical protein